MIEHLNNTLEIIQDKFDEVCKRALLTNGFDVDKASLSEIKNRCTCIRDANSDSGTICLDNKPILCFYSLETFNGFDDNGNYTIKMERKYKLL